MTQKSKKRQPYDSHLGLPLDPDVARPGSYDWPPHLTLSLQLTVFVGGCIGTVSRYVITNHISSSAGWPWGTLIVNMTGAFLLGLLLEILLRLGDEKGTLRTVRLGLGTGFMGAFTTYSTLVVEINVLAGHNRGVIALSYALVTLVGGILVSMIGIAVAASWHRKLRRVL